QGSNMKTPTFPIALLFLACGAAGPVLAKDACDLLTAGEAAHLLGVPVAETKGHGNDCVIRQAGDTLKLGIKNASPKDTFHLRQHTDEERGEEGGDDPWYEVSAVDPQHPND